LLITLQELDPKIVVLTEHKCIQSNIRHIKLNNYNLITYFAREKIPGGGVAIYSKEGVEGKEITHPDLKNLYEEKVFEFCATEISVTKHKILVCGFYRSPKIQYYNTFLDKLDKLVATLYKINKMYNIIIAGDFNTNILDNTQQTKQFINTISSQGMRYLINTPTRVTPRTSTAIDNFVTNLPSRYCQVSTIVTALSDHDGILLDLNFGTKKVKVKQMFKRQRKFCTENINNFKRYLADEQWLEMYYAPCHEKFQKFYRVFLNYFNICFPMVRVKLKSHQHNGWMTDELKVRKQNLTYLYRELRIKDDRVIKNNLKTERKAFRKSINSAKKAYYSNLIRKSNNKCKTTWNCINSDIGKIKMFHCSSIKIKEYGKIQSNPKVVSNIFNEFL
jgi:hypothetical protein